MGDKYEIVERLERVREAVETWNNPSFRDRVKIYDTLRESASTIVELAEALTPFAKEADKIESTSSARARNSGAVVGVMTWEHFDRARSALSRLKGDTNVG